MGVSSRPPTQQCLCSSGGDATLSTSTPMSMSGSQLPARCFCHLSANGTRNYSRYLAGSPRWRLTCGTFGAPLSVKGSDSRTRSSSQCTSHPIVRTSRSSSQSESRPTRSFTRSPTLALYSFPGCKFAAFR